MPSLSNAATSRLPAVHTLDDAIDPVMQLEGKYVDVKNIPGGNTNFGISLQILSKFLGKPASDDDLKNLTPDQATQIYEKLYVTGAVASLSSPQVIAAYLGLAVNSGRQRIENVSDCD